MIRLIFVLGILASTLCGQGLEYVRANYTKYEYRIPMRDGKKLFTSVYVPKDQAQKYPIMMNRTPYTVAPYGVDQYKDNLGPSPFFGKDGFIFVYQDVRGKWMSEGEFVNMTPHKAVKREKVKLPKRSMKGAYDDQATLAKRKFVRDTY